MGISMENMIWSNTHLLKKLNASLQIQAKVDKLPFDALALILLLLQHEHVVVEKLLQTLVDKVDPELLERVEVEDLKASNVQHAYEMLALVAGHIQGFVAAFDEPVKHTGIDGFGKSTHGPVNLEFGLVLNFSVKTIA